VKGRYQAGNSNGLIFLFSRTNSAGDSADVAEGNGPCIFINDVANDRFTLSNTFTWGSAGVTLNYTEWTKITINFGSHGALLTDRPMKIRGRNIIQMNMLFDEFRYEEKEICGCTGPSTCICAGCSYLFPCTECAPCAALPPPDPNPTGPIPAFANHNFANAQTFASTNPVSISGSIFSDGIRGSVGRILNTAALAGNQTVTLAANNRIHPRYGRTILSFWVRGGTMENGAAQTGNGTGAFIIFRSGTVATGTGNPYGRLNDDDATGVRTGTLAAPLALFTGNTTVGTGAPGTTGNVPRVGIPTWTQYFITVPAEATVPLTDLAISLRAGGNGTNGVATNGLDLYFDEFMWERAP
jgi:hypothetical protein